MWRTRALRFCRHADLAGAQPWGSHCSGRAADWPPHGFGPRADGSPVAHFSFRRHAAQIRGAATSTKKRRPQACDILKTRFRWRVTQICAVASCVGSPSPDFPFRRRERQICGAAKSAKKGCPQASDILKTREDWHGNPCWILEHTSEQRERGRESSQKRESTQQRDVTITPSHNPHVHSGDGSQYAAEAHTKWVGPAKIPQLCSCAACL